MTSTATTEPVSEMVSSSSIVPVFPKYTWRGSSARGGSNASLCSFFGFFASSRFKNGAWVVSPAPLHLCYPAHRRARARKRRRARVSLEAEFCEGGGLAAEADGDAFVVGDDRKAVLPNQVA